MWTKLQCAVLPVPHSAEMQQPRPQQTEHRKMLRLDHFGARPEHRGEHAATLRQQSRWHTLRHAVDLYLKRQPSIQVVRQSAAQPRIEGNIRLNIRHRAKRREVAANL